MSFNNPRILIDIDEYEHLKKMAYGNLQKITSLPLNTTLAFGANQFTITGIFDNGKSIAYTLHGFHQTISMQIDKEQFLKNKDLLP